MDHHPDDQGAQVLSAPHEGHQVRRTGRRRRIQRGQCGGGVSPLLNAGYNHQSNGRTDILSRSWDRIFAEFGFERGNLGLIAKTWYRIKESADEDDNPDITDYYGYGSLTAIYK
jgi:outer membrane phospholipase A